jgi:hypothetical protein
MVYYVIMNLSALQLNTKGGRLAPAFHTIMGYV